MHTKTHFATFVKGVSLMTMMMFFSALGLAKEEPKGPSNNPVAVIDTTMGNITVELFQDRAPKTVKNFIALATGGENASGKDYWVHPRTKKKTKTPLYSGVIFHRVIDGFMIQTGDPIGNGTGDPGYRFEDETKPTDSFQDAGVLAMANAGPNTNGSQFFITVAPTPWLNGRHTIFGKVVKGIDVVQNISKVKRDSQDRPITEVKIESVKIQK